MRQLKNEARFCIQLNDIHDYNLVMAVVNNFRTADNFFRDIYRFGKSYQLEYIDSGNRCTIVFMVPLNWNTIKNCREALLSLANYNVIFVTEGL